MSHPTELDDLRAVINDHLDFIKMDRKALADAPDRACRFLVMVAILTEWLFGLESAIAKFEVMEAASWATAIKNSSGTITEKKALAPDDPQYKDAKIKLAELKAQQYWVKTHIKIFDNAHITFRQLSRD